MSSKDNKEKIPIPLTNRKREHFFGPHVRWSKTVLDYILNPTLWIPELLVSEFFVTGTWIPDSGFRILQAELSGIPESVLPCLTQFLQRPSSLLVALFPHKYTKGFVTWEVELQILHGLPCLYSWHLSKVINVL